MEVAWITKSLFSKGIVRVEGQSNGAFFTYPDGKAYSGSTSVYGKGRNWHLSERKAMDRAQIMRRVKIKSLKKSLARVRALSFSKGTEEA